MSIKLTKAERLLRKSQPKPKQVPLPVSPVAPPPPSPPLPPVKVFEWDECYDLSWKGDITDESFTHPAKAGKALLFKIFNQLREIGAITENNLILDPFGGVGTTGIIGAWLGHRVICCELEPKFVGLAKANFALHAYKWQVMNRPQPIVIQGDSRRLRQHVFGVVSSPPYAEIATGAGGLNTKPPQHDGQQGGRRASSASQDTDQRYGESTGQLARMKDNSVDAVISSPPYADVPVSTNESGGGQINQKLLDEALARKARGEKGIGLSDNANLRYGETQGQLGQMNPGGVDAVVSSPPYAELDANTKGHGIVGAKGFSKNAQYHHAEYGQTEGQLSQLKEDQGVDAVVSSPPYAETLLNDDQRQAGKGEPLRWGTNEEYGTSPGQLGTMKETGVDAVVSSPPFGSGDSASAQSITERTDKSAEWVKANCGPAATQGYGTTPGQMAEMPMKNEQDTFWTAARDIVRECHAVLKPGGHAVWIVKAFVRNKEIVNFPNDWRKLCEYCGFETLFEAHATFVKKHAYDGKVALDGETVLVDQTTRKSFFRRLAESKGSPRIDHEVVLFMRKR